MGGGAPEASALVSPFGKVPFRRQDSNILPPSRTCGQDASCFWFAHALRDEQGARGQSVTWRRAAGLYESAAKAGSTKTRSLAEGQASGLDSRLRIDGWAIEVKRTYRARREDGPVAPAQAAPVSQRRAGQEHRLVATAFDSSGLSPT